MDEANLYRAGHDYDLHQRGNKREMRLAFLGVWAPVSGSADVEGAAIEPLAKRLQLDIPPEVDEKKRVY